MHNPENERMKRGYFIYLRRQGVSVSTRSIARPHRSPSSRNIPNTVTSKSFTFNRRSGSSASSPNKLVRGQVNG
jgi:hypothetical protein